MRMKFAIFTAMLTTTSRMFVHAAPKDDLVTHLPGFGDLTDLPFKIYSGYLNVPGPFELNDYDSLEIHYQLQTSQSSTAAADPLVTWHQGGPGGSSVVGGLYTEMGALHIDDNGPYLNEDYAWNTVANMLYLESPAGSGHANGYSACIKDGQDVTCSWDDVSQAEAYAHTLLAFKLAFPEYASNDLYLTGESYFGQYGPNIANYLLSNEQEFSSLNLKGMALGNACWGGNETFVMCNGPNSEQNDVDMYFGKGLVSKKLYQEAYATCNFPLSDTNPLTASCDDKLEQVSKSVGYHNRFNIYDNCPLGSTATAEFLEATGKSMRWYKNQIMNHMPEEIDHAKALRDYAGVNKEKMLSKERKLRGYEVHPKDGGYVWSCGGISITRSWIVQEATREALHLKEPNRSQFEYKRSGPASITLYPSLVKKLRILIYNGDSDAAVPYKGNEEWITYLESMGVLVETEAWRPWFEQKASRNHQVPAGYVTSYSVKDADKDEIDFHFLTIRLAGHMVPTFQPGPSLAFFQRFLASEPY